MTGRSTNLEALIDAAADAFQSGSPARKIIVLFSDGESLGGVLANAVNRCAKEGIILTTVAVGSDAGRPVPGITENQIQETISRRDAAVMRIAAERTGGIYIDGNRDDAAFTLSSHLLTLSQETNPGSSRPAPKERRTLFIILAILCYGISKFFPLIPRLPAASVAALIIFLSSCSEGKLLLVEANYLHSQGRHDEALIPYLKALEFEDSAPYAEYGLGLTFYLIDEGDAALKRFESSRQMLGTSTEHRELRYRNNYNTGIVYFEEGDYRSAAAAFKDALRADPRRLDAKRNLELSLLSIARQTEEDNRGERKQESEMREILFDYIREEEVQHWKSKEWSQEEKYLGPDY
jgi:Ca-activated chloride channel family protein